MSTRKKNRKVTHIPNEVIEAYWPEGYASTSGVQRYEQQVAYILSALGEFDENYKYAFVTDLSTFECFNVDKSQLEHVSGELGFDLTKKCKLVDIAEEMFKKGIHYSPEV